MADIRIGSVVMDCEGEGPPVVMVHGLGGSSNSFQTLMGKLEGYRVLRPDLPGAGRSSQKPGLPGMKGLVSALRDGLRAAGISRAHFVGHSMGTLLCQYIAAETAETVASLTLYGAILEPPAAARAALRERAETARSDGMTAIADAVSTGSVSAAVRAANPAVPAFVRESLMRQEPSGYAAHCEALAAARPADHGAIRCPTLLVAGDDDPVAPLAMARQLNARISGSQVECLPEVAHWMMLEAPQRSAELLRAHIESAAL